MDSEDWMHAYLIEITPDRFLSCHTAGEGSPGVVFESGLLADSRDWEVVSRSLGNTPVCWYDRAGRGSSSPGPMPRTAENCAEDLYRLMLAGGWGPCLLVGHSIGGFIVRAFAAAHPDLISGMILVDGSHQEQFHRIGSILQTYPLEEAGQEALRQFWVDGWKKPEGNAEGFDFPESFRQVRALPDLGDLPLTVLSAGAGWDGLDLPDPVREELNRTSAVMQLELPALSTRSRHVVVPGSSHFIQRDAPDVVAEAVRQHLEGAV